jgi:hypothetical protein
MVLAVLLSIAFIAGDDARAERIALAEGGQPQATIVLPAEAGDRLEAAATDLQHYVHAICGVELPIERDGRPVGGTGLYIGECEPTTDADMPPDGANPEGYAIRVRDGNVFFVGRWPTPTYFAVASFIEDNLGVRWFAPGELWEYVPEGQPGELLVEAEERVTTPGTSPRIWSGHAWTEDWNQWNLRNKTVMGEVVPRRQFQNFLQRVFPPEKYGETHPEYYPLINGKRWIPGEGDRYWRPCESNPEVLRLTVEYARQWFDEHPLVDSFSLGMDDISHLCGCENCRAMDPRPDSYEKREFSDRHYKFVNAVAREVATTHLDRYIGTLIYNIARTPPETVEKLEDNVFGFITETSALWWQEGRKEADHELTREWARRCKHLSRYDYYGMGCLTPRVYPHAMAEQLKFDKSLGIEGMYTEVYTFLPNTAPMIWAFAKLQWDHTLDIDKLLSDFYAKMFGDAAPVMKEYFDLLERSWNTPRPSRQGWVHRRIQNQALAMSAEDVEQGSRLLDRAMAATDDRRAKARIEIVLGGLQYGSYVIRAYDLSQKLTAAPVTDRQSAQECLAMSQRLVNLSAERERFWAEAAERDDLLGANVRGLMEKGYWITGQAPNVERGGFVAAMRVLGWYARNAPDELADVADRLSGTGGPIAEMVEAWRWAQETSPPSLLTNGDFENPAPNQERPEMDWSTRGAPTGWSVWSRTQNARFAVLAGQGQDGSAAAAISGAESACYLQGHDVKPGERYLCICWVKPGAEDPVSGARLSIRFRQPDGAWHPKRDVEPTINAVEGQTDWQPLALITTVPEGAGSLVVMLGAGGQAEGAQALFDGVALYGLR